MLHTKELNTKLTLIKGTGGAILGVGVSFIVNSTLAEISISPFFSVVIANQYFGLLFTVVGLTIIWKVRSSSSEEAKRQYFLLLGYLVVASGILCFLLERNWFIGLSATMKIPLYAILGISVSFALVFAIVDLVNYISGYFYIYEHRVLISNPQQLFGVLAMSIAMGLVFGFVFGVLDVEDVEAYQFRLALLKEEYYCYPIGALLGFITGVIVEYYKTDYISPPEKFDDEI